MDAKKKKRLEQKGWTVGSPKEFLELSEAEELFIEMKLALSQAFAERRRKRRISQPRVAELMGSSQSRVAKMEAGDRSVSLDLLTRGLLVLGAKPADIAKALSPAKTATKKKSTRKKIAEPVA